MTDSTELSLYTEDYFNANEPEILSESRCGNVVSVLEISNYVYYAIKASEYTLIPDDYKDVPEGMNESQIQADLNELRAGVFNRYAMNIGQFKQIDDMQLTAGEWYDPYTFERWWDESLAKERWRLILTRDGTEALSIQVMQDDGSYWYTPGVFIDQGDGTWLINSWDGTASTEGQRVNYQFIYGSGPISQVLSVPADITTFESYIAYGDTSPAATSTVDMDGDGNPDTVLYAKNELTISVDSDGINIDRDGDGVADIILP